MLLLTAHRRNFSDWQLKGKERFYYFFTTFQSENTSRFKKICEYLPYIKCRKDMIANADWVVDMGPGGGEEGGHIVCAGTPEDVALEISLYILDSIDKIYYITDENGNFFDKLVEILSFIDILPYIKKGYKYAVDRKSVV